MNIILVGQSKFYFLSIFTFQELSGSFAHVKCSLHHITTTAQFLSAFSTRECCFTFSVPLNFLCFYQFCNCNFVVKKHSFLIYRALCFISDYSFVLDLVFSPCLITRSLSLSLSPSPSLSSIFPYVFLFLLHFCLPVWRPSNPPKLYLPLSEEVLTSKV